MSRECFLTFCLISYFWNFGQKSDFQAFLAKTFKNKKLIKKVIKQPLIYVFRWFWHILVIFVKKYFLLQFKKFGAKNSKYLVQKNPQIFSNFSKCKFQQKILLFKQIPCEISFVKMYTVTYFTLLVLKLGQKLFYKKVKNCKGGTILKMKYKYRTTNLLNASSK